MLQKKLATATIAILLAGVARLAIAQENSGQFRPFNGFFADLFDDSTQSQPPKRQVQHGYSDNRALSWPGQAQRTPTRAQPHEAARSPLATDPPVAPPAAVIENDDTMLPRSTAGPIAKPRSSSTGADYSLQADDGLAPVGPSLKASAPSTWVSSSPNDSPATSSTRVGVPLHERLRTFRQSPFGDAVSTTTSSSPVAAAPAEVAPNPAGEPASHRPAETANDVQHAPTPATPAPNSLPGPRLADEPQHPATTKPTNNSAQEPSVLTDRKSPLLTVETIGPRKIVIGKEAAYEVLLQNSGDVAAEEVTVTVGLPEWAEVAGASPSAGEVHAAVQNSKDPCRWILKRIEARSKEKLSLKIIPRQSKPFELAVRWDFKQAASQAMIEVQEPKLTIRLDGPREVLFGKKENYKLKLGNCGNGPGENIVLTLMPLSSSDTHPITHRLGTVNAGDERSIEIELTARQAGNLTIRVEAKGDGGAHAELAEQVVVHRPNLQVDVEGPTVQYVGTPSNYRIHLRNPGDAPARNVKLTAKLPTGVKFLSGSDGAIADTTAEGGKVRWTIEQLQPGSDQVVEMRCTLALSGDNRVEFSVAADDDLVAATETITRGEAMADLRLDVKDPDNPVPVGSDASYELHIRNRGTKAAENVEVMVYFSSGVEPVGAEGQSHHISPGQVVFDRIGIVAPAAEVLLRLKAKATLAGNHVFRAEVHCKTMGARLVREQVTHYYQDGPMLQAQSAPAKSEPTSTTSQDHPRTAERQPLPLPQSGEQPLPAPAIKR
jgi:uncharacterized repeat protein (TIGR01451 family)